MKKNERRASFFLKLLILRERHRPQSQRLVVRLHAPKLTAPVAVPIRFPRYFSSVN